MNSKIKSFFTNNLTRTISLSFFMVIFIGSILLSLPIANKGAPIPYLDHLFVATSATCVTGLVPVVVAKQYNLFGQIVVLFMIQIGGLGFITLLMILFLFLKKRLSFSTRLLMAEAINQNNLEHINEFIRYIFKYTLTIEALGAASLFIVFIQDYPFLKAVYYSIFHAISAFCNAGFDILGSSSLMMYQNNPWVLFVISMLIIMGGIGFLVAKEIQECIKNKISFKKFSLHTKLVLIMTLSFIVVGAILVYFMERNNPNTIGNLPFIHQITNSFFQSITYRTAGFASFDQGALSESSKLVGCFIMIVGGSPAGTAGGIKTVTVATLFFTVLATLKGRKDVVVFSRTISLDKIISAICVICISLFIVVTSSVLLCMIEPFNMIDLLYEVFSAFATVGLTANITPHLSNVGKFIIMILMYIGRIGPVAMMLTLMRKRHQNIENEIKYPNGDILVG